MRSRPLKIFLAVACLFALSAGSLVTLLVFRAATHRCLKNALSAAGQMAVSQAQAEEMKFTPLSSDSLSQLERSGRHSNRGSSSVGPTPPAPPAPPEELRFECRFERSSADTLSEESGVNFISSARA